MTRIITNDEVQTIHVTFEPGNATRYRLLVTYIPEELISVTDLNNKRVILFNPVCESAEHIEIRLIENDYGCGDAGPMARQLAETFKALK